MTEYLLSKSDFKIARTCPAKLFYKKLGYPTSNDGNEYMEYLAEGGYMIGKLAQVLRPGGILIESGNPQKAAELTAQYLQQENVILFEAAIKINGKVIRIDILEKNKDNLNLIEVKSKSWNSSEEKDLLKAKREIREYIEDVAYQYLVLSEAYPQFNIKSYLYLPDKNKRTTIEGLNQLFRLKEIKPTGSSKFKSFDVTFEESRLDDVMKDDLMTLLDVQTDVDAMLEEIRTSTDDFLASLHGEIEKIPVPISKTCFGCEYCVTDEVHPKSGYDECWKDMPNEEHHVKDLYHIGTIGGYKEPLVNKMISEKKLSIFDVPMDYIKGKRGERQLIQIQSVKENKEWMHPMLKKILNSWEYPIHFIDFETSVSALPYHKGMHPYEPIAFQWSCHTITKLNAEPIHSEWLNVEPGLPNFKFAGSLMNHIGDNGTLLMWATHENTILRNIYHQMEQYGYKDSKLKQWLETVIKIDKDDHGRFIDMNKLTLENYFHPYMGGRTSIKKTLPAVLRSITSPRIKKWLEEFEPNISLYGTDEKGEIINPYKLLPPIDLFEQAEKLQDGTGAMRTYDDLIYGVSKNDNTKVEKYKEALLRYCKLDTLAMVIIWEKWRTHKNH